MITESLFEKYYDKDPHPGIYVKSMPKDKIKAALLEQPYSF